MIVVRACPPWARVAIVAAGCVMASTAACGSGSTPTSPSAPPATAGPPSAPPAPEPPRPPVTFGQGQHRVGTDIQPGRYYSDPAPGCYWERQSGLGGTPTETIAFQIVNFDAAQWVVDILPADRGFLSRPACGTWSDAPAHPAQTSIPPGIWVVGVQVAPGVYQTSAAAGCYWERLRHFNGQPDAIVASDLVGAAGPQFVTVLASDAGVRSDAACGTWMRAP